jgi:hypothetical protein
MSDGARDLLVRGIAAANAGDREEAHRYLEWALRQEPTSEQETEARLWLSETAGDEAEARRWVEEVLAGEPHNPRALRRLALLDGRLRPSELIDPDSPPVDRHGIDPVAVERFDCPSCGGPMAYAPDGDGLQCDHCGQRVGVRRSAAGDAESGEDFVLALATARGHQRAQASPTFACPACGARFLLPPATLSLSCPYCEAAYAVGESEARLLVAPQAIAPLKVALDEARGALAAWARGKGGGEAVRIEKLSALYLPLWIFELGGVIEWTAEGGRRGWLKEEDARKGAESPLSPIIVLACARPRPGAAAAAESLEPGRLTAFDPAYLASLPAETYTLSMADAALRARQRSLRRTGEKLMAEAGGVRLSLRSARMVVSSVLLALAPVWLGEVRIGDAARQAAVNGITATVHTEDATARSFTD